MRVIDNVTAPLTLGKGVPPDVARVRALKALERVGLSNKEESYPAQLSVWQQQRVGIARALVVGPEVMLLDMSRPRPSIRNWSMKCWRSFSHWRATV